MGTPLQFIDHCSQVKPYISQGTITKGMVVVRGTLPMTVKPPTGSGADDIVGVALEDATSGQNVSVAGAGAIVPVVAGAAVAINAKLMIGGATGKVITLVAAANPGAPMCGVALEAAAADGDKIGMEIRFEHISNAT